MAGTQARTGTLRGLLALIVVANLTNVSLLSPAIPGPEQYLANRPLLVVTTVLVQIVMTLGLVGVLARRGIRRSS
jgi:hypothetical protein